MFKSETKKRKLSNVITTWLLVVVVLACAVSVIITSMVISSSSEAMARRIVRQNVDDIWDDIAQGTIDRLYAEMASYLTFNMYQVPSANTDDPDLINTLNADVQEALREATTEINVVNSDGIIIVSSAPENVGTDIADHERLAEFRVLLDGTATEHDNLWDSFNNGYDMAYTGRAFSDGSGFMQLGGSLSVALPYEIQNRATHRRIGETGYFLLCQDDMTVVGSMNHEHDGENLSDADYAPKPDVNHENETFLVDGVPAYVNVAKLWSYYVVGIYPKAEIKEFADRLLFLTTGMEVLVFGLLFVLLSILLRKKVVKNIVRVNDSLQQISGGNLEEKVDVRDTREFDLLSDDINKTVDRLKGYIAEAEARIDKDLAVAKAIQTSILPSHFPAFPDKKEFELYAGMKAAKEVGGDFYDFFMIDETTLGFLIADVSGKSIPGAMFMMRAKTVIKELALRGLAPGEVVTTANVTLCEGNDAGMFVTCWLGFLDIRTGVVRAVNAGHNPPMLIRGGQAEYVKLKPSLIMGTFDIARYKEHTFTLEPGDFLYLYTDGVTEAENADAVFYGEERLQTCLSFGERPPAPSGENGMAEAVCRIVEDDLAVYTKGAEQSDDITMLCIRFSGCRFE